MHAQVVQAGLAHHKQETCQMVSSALKESRLTESHFLAGILEACNSFRGEVMPQAA